MKKRSFALQIGAPALVIILAIFAFSTLSFCGKNKTDVVNEQVEKTQKQWITAVVYRNSKRNEAKVIDNLLWLDNDDFIELNGAVSGTEKWKAWHFAEKGDTIVYRFFRNGDFEIKDFLPHDR